MHSRLAGVVVGLAAVAMVVAGCGGSGKHSATTSGPTDSAGAIGSLGVGATSIAAGTSTAAGSSAASHGASSSAPGTHGSSSTHVGGATSHASSTHAGAPSSSHSVAPSGPRITVTPSSGLAATQTVTIVGAGYDPNTTIIAVECVDMGNSTGASDCNINLFSLPKGFKPNADGTFTTTLQVKKTFSGHTCGSPTPCLVSVNPAKDSTVDQADQEIYFA